MAILRRAWAGPILNLMVTLATLPCLADHAAKETMTPLLLAVHDAPVPFSGSDGQIHLAYELWVTNFSSGDALLQRVEIMGDGAVVATLDANGIAARLQAAGERQSSGTLAKGSQGLLFVHITLPPGTTVPKELSHRVALRASAAPPELRQMSETGGAIEVDRRKVVVIGPPLRGERFVSADSCCDAVRHTRAALPVNGRVWLTQRMAVDWEQLDEAGRVSSGPRTDVKSFVIFGKEALAVADAVVASTTDGLPEQTPGSYPSAISLDQADGNSVILDLGGGNYALYAHLQPGSIRVRQGDRVKRGEVLGLVGNTGNSLAPHLHFQVMDGPSSLASNGLPYEIDRFEVIGKTPGTEAFDEAEEKGTPVAVTPLKMTATDAFPLDQLVISFLSAAVTGTQ